MTINIENHELNNLECSICKVQPGNPDVELCYICGGIIHVEYIQTWHSKDDSDTKEEYEYCCDLCGSTDNDYMFTMSGNSISDTRKHYRRFKGKT